MTQPQHQPTMNSIVSVQKQEIDRLNDNRIYLLALVEELTAELTNARVRLLETASVQANGQAQVVDQAPDLMEG